MATVTPTVVTKRSSNKITVTWAGMGTGDTIVEHLVQQAPALLSVQATGTFANGTSVGLTASNDSTNFVACVDYSGGAISAKLAAFMQTCATSAVGYKPSIASGSSDSVTVVLAYWG